MGAAERAKLSAEATSRAAARKAAGIHENRKPLTQAQHDALSQRMKTQAATRKAEGIHIHRTPLTSQQRASMDAKRKATLAAMSPDQREARHERISRAIHLAAERRKAAGIKVHRKPLSADARAKLSARAKAQWAKMPKAKKEKIINYLREQKRH